MLFNVVQYFSLLSNAFQYFSTVFNVFRFSIFFVHSKSNKFESREYQNLSFLKTVSSLLSEDAPFQVDSLDHGPERFSLSGTIGSYDRLQILKTNLKSIEEFKSGNIVESNRKSPDGIVYRISIDLN
jgi:hypothetical protein